jgi:hypothetical protein
MRVVRALAAGGTATGIAFAVAAWTRGFAADVAVVLAVFAGLVTIGVAVDAAIDAWFDRPVVNPNLRGAERTRRDRPRRCGRCRRRLRQVGSLTVCPRCDLTAAR